MWLLTSIVMFIIAAIVAACSGDYSGIKSIAQIVGGIAIALCIGCLLAYKPVLFWLLIAVFLIYVVYDINRQNKNK